MTRAWTNVTDITGQRFGRLVVVGRAPRAASPGAMWTCLCDCGTSRVIRGSTLRRGVTRSCGCLNRELVLSRSTTHGHAGGASGPSPEYRVWHGMIQRCTNPNHKRWADWGGRGITVCERWVGSFVAFLEDMGVRPPGKTLDRVDNDRGYSKDNCRWATRSEQQMNRRPRRTGEA